MDDGENRERFDQPGLEEDEATSERALVPLQVSQVDFYGDKLMVVLVEIQGEHLVLVPLRQFCQYLGVDWASQYQRTKRDEILAREMMSVVITTTLMPVRGQRQSYPALCLPLDLLPGWLFNINPSHVKLEYRERVQRYRGLCYRALWRAFQRGELFPVEEPTIVEASAPAVTQSYDPRVVALSEQIETLSAIVELMQEHKASLLAEAGAMAQVSANQRELLTRTDMISSQLDYVVTLLEGLVGRQETIVGRQEKTETKVAKIDERTARLSPAHAKYVHEMVDRKANRLKDAGLEQIRDMYDRGRFGLILLGMPGLEKRLARAPQLYSRIGFAHQMDSLSEEETHFFLDQRWSHRVSAHSEDFTDQEAVATIFRITRGNMRLIERLMMQVEHILVANQLQVVTKEVVETARENLIIGLSY